ncbi:hypothetical protein CR513_11086, partial [Mucuna pruriens]
MSFNHKEVRRVLLAKREPLFIVPTYMLMDVSPCVTIVPTKNKVSIDLSFKSPFVRRLHGRTQLHMEKEGDLVLVHLRKELFSHLRKSKLLLRRDDLFKIIKKINDDAYRVEMFREFGGKVPRHHFEVKFPSRREGYTYLKSYSQEEKEEEATHLFESLMTKGRLQKEARGSASKGLAMLHSQEEALERRIVYHLSSHLNDWVILDC